MSQESLLEGPSSEHKTELNEENFLKELYLFMKSRDTPIERIPHLGFKQIDLFLMYKTVQKLGGYSQVTAHQLWKQVYNELGGNPRSTSAATCTRRHYEKLILPFEWHMRGKDDKDLPVPRQQKRSRLHSFPHEEEEDLRGAKRGMSYGLRHALASQDTHDFLVDSRMGVIPVPVHFQQYFHNHPSLPPYHPVTPMVQPPHTNLTPPISHIHPPQEKSDWPKQQLVLLRNLAKEYISSSGFAEPLNLSCKDGAADCLNQKPSSFTPTGSNSNKMPRFLNKVFPLYPAWNLPKDEVSDGTENEKGPNRSSPRHSPVTIQEPNVIDLSSTTYQNTSPATTPSVHMKAYNSMSLQNCRPNDSDSTYPMMQKEAERPSHPALSPFNMSNPILTSPKDPTGKMEIQIPLAVLQDLLNAKFRVGSQLLSSSPVSQPDKGQVIINEDTFEHKASLESIPQENGSRPLTLQVKERKCSLEEADHIKSSPKKKTNVASPSGRESHLDSYHVSLGIQAHDWESASECKKNLPHLNMPINNGAGSAAYRQMCSQDRDYEVQKPSTIRNIQIQDLMLDRNSSQAQLARMWLNPGSHVAEHEIKRPQATVYVNDTLHSRDPLSRHFQGMPLAIPERHSMLMVNPASPSLMPLTLEECLKLRRLISSSP
ncbi:AT-rich interaction domain 6 isoform X1 [Paramormyrops kingsleyae]|uniref:Uncharacterized LOC111847065 n=1 Tax=Paramormyrops kingsleyae TaxID=1676925 RepID=A0A3B3RHQ7_9TELE|nr:uncharacterized protein LOC111847065 isoform X1 [Paramormyrops kingsleyae]